MTMDITRNVILDLFPLYLADEVSADTKALIESYLETDPELANAAKKLAPLEKPETKPSPLSQDAEVIAYRKAKKQQFFVVLALTAVLSSLLIAILAIFFLGSS